jgi:hypothetical protein
MTDTSVKIAQKIERIKFRIEEHGFALWDQEVNVKVGKRSGNKEMVKAAEDTMVKLEKQKDVLQEILNDLVKESKKDKT